MNRAIKLSFARCSAIAAIAVLAQACASQSRVAQQPPEPQHTTVRQTAQTAPADLQLLCASEAARAYGVPSERVLPVSSSAQGEVYTVVLNTGGTQAVCTIDEEGTVLSLDRA